MSICLSNQELYDLTHYRRATAQRTALNMMGIDYKVRPDGTLAVFRETAIQNSALRPRKKTEPDWKAVS